MGPSSQLRPSQVKSARTESSLSVCCFFDVMIVWRERERERERNERRMMRMCVCASVSCLVFV